MNSYLEDVQALNDSLYSVNSLILEDLESSSTASLLGGIVVYCIVALIVSIFMIVSMWKLYKKAGKPGWASIVPIYNVVVLFQIAGMNPWLILLELVPVVNIVIMVMVYIQVAKNFGHGVGYAIGLILLPIIFIPMLAFGNSEYQG